MSLSICQVRVDGCRSLPIIGTFVLTDEYFIREGKTPEASAAYLVLIGLQRSGFLRAHHVDHFFTVASLPRRNPEFLTHRVLSDAHISAGHVVELGSNCATVLDALILCASVRQPLSSAIVMCADSFATTYKAGSDSLPWQDGGAAIVFGESQLSMLIESYVTATDVDFSELCSFENINSPLVVGLGSNVEFLERDISTEIRVAEQALFAANIGWSDVDGYVTVNRSSGRASKLRGVLDLFGVALYESRNYFGHRGGSDLINNLNRAIFESENFKVIRLILIGNGLGYTWTAMVVKIRCL